MRKAIAVVISGFVAMLACHAQDSVPLEVRDDAGALQVRTKHPLSAAFWPDGVGTAKVEIEAVPQNAVSSSSSGIQYEIKNGILAARIPYARKNTKKALVTVRLSGIKDSKGPNHTSFVGQITLSQGPGDQQTRSP